MSFIGWLTRSVDDDLSQRVYGTSGLAHAELAIAAGDGELFVRARLANGHRGPVELRARPMLDDGPGPERCERGELGLAVALGPAEPFRGTELQVDAFPVASGTTVVAALEVEVTQRSGAAPPDAAPLARETYSVESRFDANGQARLGLVLRLV